MDELEVIDAVREWATVNAVSDVIANTHQSHNTETLAITSV